MIDIYSAEAQARFSTIVIDPPWNQGKTGKRSVRPNQSTRLDYPTMTKEEIKALPISNIAQGNSFIFLWATNSKDRKTGEPVLKMAFDLLDAWGFQFYTMITWDKKTGPCPFGPFQIVTEHVLFGYRGKCFFKRDKLGFMKNHFSEVASMHSVKPDSFYRAVAEITDGERIDIFSRQNREGFHSWGDEVGKLDLNVRKPKKALKCNDGVESFESLVTLLNDLGFDAEYERES